MKTKYKKQRDVLVIFYPSLEHSLFTGFAFLPFASSVKNSTAHPQVTDENSFSFWKFCHDDRKIIFLSPWQNFHVSRSSDLFKIFLHSSQNLSHFLVTIFILVTFGSYPLIHLLIYHWKVFRWTLTLNLQNRLAWKFHFVCLIINKAR